MGFSNLRWLYVPLRPGSKKTYHMAINVERLDSLGIGYKFSVI